MRLFDSRDLTKVYRMSEVEVHALRQVTLALDQGQFVVLHPPDTLQDGMRVRVRTSE